ncbi:hypothetical protein [Streptomyces sp. NBC_00083]|uniref:hypothetical protein n=1 Tax=Streptomyces sp. NBC_00083 TaxID=2975647 RepID=UPI00225BA418|nr:hypothetical protein [Streptomyces sp. NBC_00083]MCX5387068.1 hypothetical protein [Streptomyces sp. NBC_00083]
MIENVKRAIALGAATAALAGGVAFSSVGAAEAAPQHTVAAAAHGKEKCHVVKGYWTKTWHKATRDRHGKVHPGYWTKTWHKAHKVCHR